ncbi:MAG: hypothetical protein ACRCZI_13065 [Cetobacterium sp.]
MDEWLLFIGIYISFGYISYVEGTIVFNMRNMLVENTIDWLNRIEHHFPHDFIIEIQENTIILRCMILYNYLKIYGYGLNRKMELFMLQLDTRQSRILLSSILISSKYKNFRYLVNYQTESMILADQLQILAFNCEFSANIISTETDTFKKQFLDIDTSKKICVVISNRLLECEPKLITKEKIKTKFTGLITNITIKNETCLVRRNKKYCWF